MSQPKSTHLLKAVFESFNSHQPLASTCGHASQASKFERTAAAKETSVTSSSAGWLSEAELDAPGPVGVTSEEVEMTAALVGKDGKLEPAGRAECSAVHDAIMALVEEGAGEGNEIQVGL